LDVLTPDGNPSGARNVSAVQHEDRRGTSSTVRDSGNYEVDPVTGRVLILDDADILSTMATI
jgi:hypothetical protein